MRGKAITELGRLRPTQLTLGYAQVLHKKEVTQRHDNQHDRATLRRFMRRHRIQTVAGPGGALFVVKHHHWARAWIELGYRRGPVRILRDFSYLSPSAFWKRMRALGHVHPYDEHGERLDVRALPATVMGMRDDPYRSLAAFARDAGAYSKPGKPGNAYGESQWAGFFRSRVQEDFGTIAGFALALTQAIRLAGSSRARKLPGYCGAVGKQ